MEYKFAKGISFIRPSGAARTRGIMKILQLPTFNLLVHRFKKFNLQVWFVVLHVSFKFLDWNIQRRKILKFLLFRFLIDSFFDYLDFYWFKG